MGGGCGRKRFRRCRVLAFFLLAGLGGSFLDIQAAEQQPGVVSADSTTTASPAVDAAAECRQLATLIEQQKSLLSRETGQIKRELAALREDLDKPGLREIFAGIGYIFGLAGVGFYFHSRRGRLNGNG